ncbi:hypothetical protein DDI_2853 [Dickeya dianthicola RNS04.9]|nr:hypothetical protein DDI_2853 [Dickeya dianthicola RNS04.9]
MRRIPEGVFLMACRSLIAAAGRDWADVAVDLHYGPDFAA